MSETSATSVTTTGVLNVPVLPLRDVVVYPHMVIPLFVGREKSILAEAFDHCWIKSYHYCDQPIHERSSHD